ncbi:Carboxypeptidase Q, partial [Toxocara canis]
FRKSSHELLDFVIKGNGSGIACEWLSRLVDEFGHRHLGSENLDKAIDYVVNGLKEDGFDNVHTEEVPDLPKWVRGDDIVEMIEPRVQRFNALAIDGCPPANVTAEAIVLQDLRQLKDHNVSGKIVVFAQKWMGYSKTAKYRRAAMKVQEIGAVGVLVKSITPYSLALPHTGSGARGSRIPALAITLEEADMLLRMQNRGKKIVIRLDIKSHPDGIVASRNILFEIRG